MQQSKTPADDTQKKAPGFMMYDDVSAALQELDDTELGQVMRAAITYKLTSECPTGLPRMLAMVFALLRGKIDDDNARYIEKCAKNRQSANARYGTANACERMPTQHN